MRAVILSFLCYMFVWASTSHAKEEFENFTVLADPSLAVPLNLIARDYSLQRNISVTTVFSPTTQQIHSIEQGAEATVLISAKYSWINLMQQKGLIDVYSRKNIARNRLILASSQFEAKTIDVNKINDVNDLSDNPADFMLAIGNPAYTAEGGYAIQSLNAHNLHLTLEPHYSFFRNMYQLIDTIHRYRAMGIIFRSDALLHPKIKELSAFSPTAHRPVIYQGVVIAGDHMELGREFLDYLGTPQAARIFKAYGFDPAI